MPVGRTGKPCCMINADAFACSLLTDRCTKNMQRELDWGEGYLHAHALYTEEHKGDRNVKINPGPK